MLPSGEYCVVISAMQRNKTERIPTPSWLSSDSIVMFALIFMTSTRLLQSLDIIKVCPLSSINIFFIAGEWGKVVTSYYMDELHFLTSSAFYQQRSCSVTCRDGQNWTSVWLTSSTHFFSETVRHLTTTLIHTCLSVCGSGEKARLLISTHCNRLKIFTAKPCFNWLWLKEKRSQIQFCHSETRSVLSCGCSSVSVNGAAW